MNLFLFGAGASYGAEEGFHPTLGADLFRSLQNYSPNTWGETRGTLAATFAGDFERGLVELAALHPHALPPLQLTLHDNIVIRISRLTDETTSRGHTHLTLHALPRMSRAVGLSDEIREILGRASDTYKELTKQVATIREHRNNRIAHHNLELATGGVTLDPIDHKELANVMESIWKFMNVFHDHFRNSVVGYGGHWLADSAQAAVNVLAHGIRLMDIEDMSYETDDDAKVGAEVRRSFPIPRVPN